MSFSFSFAVTTIHELIFISLAYILLLISCLASINLLMVQYDYPSMRRRLEDKLNVRKGFLENFKIIVISSVWIELVYRYAIQGMLSSIARMHLEGNENDVYVHAFSIFITSFIYALVHCEKMRPDNIDYMYLVTLLSSSMLFGILKEYRGIYFSIFAHVFHNTLAFHCSNDILLYTH